MTPNKQQRILERIDTIEKELQQLRQLLLSDSPQDMYEQEDCVDVDVIDSAANNPEEILVLLFTLIQKKQSSEALQKDVLPLLHSSIADHSPAIDSFFRFSFKTFQGRWKEYLDAQENRSSFQIERRKENHRGELMELKLYLISQNRSPSPITFRQDPKVNLNWKIQSLSL